MIHRNQQSLKQKVDQALNKLRANGELIKISERYFGKDITKN
ncbi:transporter substrate-binding domain-containing protein [Amylolactobacillus amylophilus]|nr:transporter substrate-binding domain-containing protein [Amylolactobacillus amylophilus]